MTRKIVQILVHCLVSCLAAKRQVRQRDKRRIRYLVSKEKHSYNQPIISLLDIVFSQTCILSMMAVWMMELLTQNACKSVRQHKSFISL